MASIKYTLFTIPVIAVYLLSVIGVGTYSCNCKHSSQIALFGIVTKCDCTHENCHTQIHHKCICGGDLIAKQHKKDDCCKIKFKFLKSDQLAQDQSKDLLFLSSTLLLPQSNLFVGISLLKRPLIKNFHALFRCWEVHILEKNSQLLL